MIGDDFKQWIKEAIEELKEDPELRESIKKTLEEMCGEDEECMKHVLGLAVVMAYIEDKLEGEEESSNQDSSSI